MAITEEERIHVARDCVMILNMKVSSEEKKRLGKKYLEGYSHEDRMKILNTDITTMDEEDYYTFLTEFYGEGILDFLKMDKPEDIHNSKDNSRKFYVISDDSRFGDTWKPEYIDNLAIGIIAMAAEDYREALKTRSNKCSRFSVKEIEQFFRSQWFGRLTDADPEYIMERIRDEVDFPNHKRDSEIKQYTRTALYR